MKRSSGMTRFTTSLLLALACGCEESEYKPASPARETQRPPQVQPAHQPPTPSPVAVDDAHDALPAIPDAVEVNALGDVVEGIRDLMESLRGTAVGGFDDEVINRVVSGAMIRLTDYRDKLKTVSESDARRTCEAVLDELAERLPDLSFDEQWVLAAKDRLARVEDELLDDRKLLQEARREEQAEKLAEAQRQAALRGSLELKIGAVGRLPHFRVDQVIDRGSLLISIGTAQKPAILRGLDASGFVDDQTYDLGLSVEVVGTESYSTVLGSTRTVYSLEVVNVDK
jgi:hypothetical protein